MVMNHRREGSQRMPNTVADGLGIGLVSVSAFRVVPIQPLIKR